MLYLSLHGVRLVLRRGTEMAMELVNNLLADGIEDSHSMPLELPVPGNEIVLGHVHELPLRSRTLELPGMHSGHNGLPLHEGTFRVLGSNHETVRGTLSAEAFVTLMGDTKLRTLLQELAIDMVAASGSVAEHVMASNTAASMVPGDADTGWTHYFPLYSNPALYGSENPHWFPDAPEWDAAATYEVDELVTFYELVPVRRGWRWQCIVDTTAGQSPLTHPLKWKRTAFGLVNVTDPETGEPVTNDADGNFYALVPWFRLRYLVLQVLEHYGLHAAGDAFLKGGPLGPDSMYTLGNNVPLDAELQEYYFLASQTTPVNFTPGDDYRLFAIPAQDDSVAPNQDSTDVWDPVNMTFTPPAAGSYRIIVEVDVNFTVAALLKVLVRKADGAPFPIGFLLSGLVYIGTEVSNVHKRTVSFVVPVSAGQVGSVLHFAVEGVVDGVVVWPVSDEHRYANCRVQGWRTQGDGINSFRPRITVTDHLPDWTVAEFLDRVADTFNLEVLPTIDKRAVQFNSRMGVLRKEVRNTTDQSHRLLGAPELDHTRATAGVRFAWDVDLGDAPAMQNMYRIPDVNFEDELDPPGALQLYVVVRSTRKVYVSVFKESALAWEQRGYLLDDALQGSADGAREITPHFVPPHMEEVRVDGEQYVVPYMEEAGSSSFFGTLKNEGTAWLSIANGYSHGKLDDTPYVTANSWGRAYSGTAQPASLLLAIDPDDMPAATNHWASHHAAWWAMVVAAEPVLADLLTDPAYLKGMEWRRFQQMGSQTYLAERLPMVYGEGGGPLVCRGAQLLRIRPTDVAIPQPAFTCNGPGYGAVVITEEIGTISAVTTSGYWTLRAADGTLYTIESGSSADMPAGTYCMWPSNSVGQLGGSISELFANAVDSIVTSGFGASVEQMELYLTGASIDLSNNTGLIHLILSFAGSTLDLSGNTLLRSLQLVFTGTALDLTSNADLLDLLVLDADLATVILHGSAALRIVYIIGASLDVATVDLLCNALDATATGHTSNLGGGTNAAPTAASLSNRTAYIGNGNTLTTN